MKYSFNPADLTSEKSLWDIHLAARGISANPFHIVLNTTTASLLALNAFILTPQASSLLGDIRTWATNGFNFTITTLGFLIAGFTIFTTLAKPDMLLAFMNHYDSKTKLPTLKANLFAFMRVFIAYIGCAGMYLFILLFCQPGGVVERLIELLPRSCCIKSLGIKVAYVIIGTSFVYLLLILKTFVFNVYAIVMNFLRWEYVKENQES